MEQKLEIRKEQKPVVMKSGLVHWISKETHERLQAQLANQQAHSFVRIAELGITINTAEIEGAYGNEEYDALEKTKQGMWQCQYRKWHERKNTCFCARDIARKRDDDVRRQRGASERKPGDETAMSSILSETRKDLEARGIVPKQNVKQNTDPMENRTPKGEGLGASRQKSAQDNEGGDGKAEGPHTEARIP